MQVDRQKCRQVGRNVGRQEGSPYGHYSFIYKNRYMEKYIGDTNSECLISMQVAGRIVVLYGYQKHSIIVRDVDQYVPVSFGHTHKNIKGSNYEYELRIICAKIHKVGMKFTCFPCPFISLVLSPPLFLLHLIILGLARLLFGKPFLLIFLEQLISMQVAGRIAALRALSLAHTHLNS